MCGFEPNIDYLCGLIDSRGWFFCSKEERHHLNPNGCGFHFIHYFVFESYDEKICKMFLNFFRVGKIKKVKSNRVDLPKYYWRIMSTDLESFIHQVYSHCFYQREMMDIILLLRNTYNVPYKKGIPLPDSIVEERIELIDKFKEVQKKIPWTKKRM